VINFSIISEEVIIHGLNHQIRREILQLLNDQPKTFSEILGYFDISTGKLNYHLNQIKGFLKKNDQNKYELTTLGSKALEILSTIRKEFTESDRALLKEAFISQRNGTKPLILQGISLGIGALVFLTCITTFLIVVFLTVQDSPIFIWPILLTMLTGEILGLIWTIRVKKSAPAFIERINKHLKEDV